jgi:hypothetical protein
VGRIPFTPEYRQLQLTIRLRQHGAKIDPGKTALASHSGRIGRLSSARASDAANGEASRRSSVLQQGDNR